jgi:hypothetical protein
MSKESPSTLQLVQPQKRAETADPHRSRKDERAFDLETRLVPDKPDWEISRSEARSLFVRFIVRWSREKAADRARKEAA